jgi:GTP cyclohydrolase I
MIDKEKIAYHIREIIKALGDDPNREGLLETPDRVARMYEEMFRGIGYTNAEIAEKYAKTFTEDDMCTTKSGNYVVVAGIPIFSHCEHHMALMYNMKVSVIYRPVDKVIGLSKIARIAEMVSHRLQLQERIGTDIAEIMQLATGSPDVGVIVEGEHSCMTARGIKKPGAVTRSCVFKGIFEADPLARKEALLLFGEAE